MLTEIICLDLGGSSSSDGEAGSEVRSAEPVQQRPGVGAGQGLEADGAGRGGEEEHGDQRDHGH